MNNKACILLDIVDGKIEQVVQILRETPGVVMVEALEGPPDVILVMAAAERQHLAKLTIRALALVETMTEHLCLLPARDRLNSTNAQKFSLVNGGRDKRRG